MHQHDKHKRDHDNGQHPENVEVGERRCQICERLQGQLPRGDRIAGLLQKQPGSLIKEGTRSRIKGIEPFAKTEAVELVTALLHRLSQRGPHTRIDAYQQYGAANASVRRAAQAKRRGAVERPELPT